MITADTIKQIAEVKLAESTNFIVDIAIKQGNKITVLLDNDKGISIADCVAMSRHIEFSLDREKEDFELSVSSPGLDQPLKTHRQYKKYVGKQVEVLTTEGTKHFGKLLNVTNDGVQLETKSKQRVQGKQAKQIIIETINLNFNQIKETKIIVTF